MAMFASVSVCPSLVLFDLFFYVLFCFCLPVSLSLGFVFLEITVSECFSFVDLLSFIFCFALP